jgi:hypothetical protein
MRFTTRQFILDQCARADLREALKNPPPRYVVFYSAAYTTLPGGKLSVAS